MCIRVICFLILFFSFQSHATKESSSCLSYQFRHLTIDNGLSHSDANVVVQDKTGFIWIGTYSGLNRYDGYELRRYYNELSYINAPYLNRIYDISVSDEGLLWLATAAGVQLFDPYTEQFIPIRVENEIYRDGEYELEKILSVGTSYILVKNNENRITMYKINDNHSLTREPFHIEARCFSLYKDKKQRVWISTSDGLYVLQNNNVWSHFLIRDGNGIKSSSVRFSFVNQKEELLVATEQKLYLFKRKVDELFDGSSEKALTGGLPLPVDLSKGWITDLLQDLHGDYWVASLKGLYHIQKENEGFKVYSIFAGNYHYSLTSDVVSRLLLDNSGNLFVSTYGGGVNVLDINQAPFFFMQKKMFETNTLSENIVRAITESDDYLWLGTNSAGLNCMERENGHFTYYNINAPAPSRLSSDGIRALLNDDEGTLWVGHTEGLDWIDLQKRSVFHIPELEQLPLGEVTSMVKDCFNQIWIGTWSKGIARVRKKEDGRWEGVLFKSAKPDYPAFTPFRIITVYADSIRPEVLFSSGKQLIRLFLDTNGEVEKSLIYQANDAKEHSLSSNFICSMARESDTVLWVGCIGGGLNRMCLLPDGDYRAETFSSREGLDQTDIESLQIDGKGNIWLGANGLTEYVPAEHKFNSYRTIDGYSVNSFKVGGSFRGKDDWLYFGGIKGVVYFNPAGIKKNEIEARPEISSVIVNNERLPSAEKFRLAYDQNNITVYFTGLHYSAPEKCMFRYRLVPFDKTWKLLENGMHSVNYANLPYGDYQLELSASNNDGIWGMAVRNMPVRISPPWWWSPWAKILYGVLVLLFLYGVCFYLLRWFNLKKQLEIKHLQEAQNEHIHRMQLQFFTNISHEFRTPLTLMQGTVEKVCTTQTWDSSFGDLLMRNVKRLTGLVDELIDFRKAETGGFRLAVCEQDIYQYIRKIVEDFNLLGSSRNIRFQVSMPERQRIIWFDPEIMERIVLNLLNNAFKYTKEGGLIEVVADDPAFGEPAFENRYAIESGAVSGDCFFLYIQDNGVGISKESIGKIFTRYYRIQDSDYDPHLGSGVGLALVKSLLLLHKGNLTIYSERGKGTSFRLVFPCSREHYKENEICSDTRIILPEIKSIPSDSAVLLQKAKGPAVISGLNLLLVEDNDEVRDFLVEALSDTYVIRQATDGLDALSIIRQQIPDLIISDLMMPNMDGYELCRTLKKESLYSSVPFIMLTAKASLDARIEGTEAGADAYLAKPVSIHLLRSVIRNLLIQRKRMKETLSTTYLQDAFDETIQAKDKEFFDHFLRVVSDNLSDPALDVNLIAQQMGYSRTRLYQKVKEIIDKPVMELVRQLRFRKAVQIMAEENLPVSEIILKIGIVSQSYFTNAFKKEYGTTPAQYMKNLKGKDTE